jgi:hypothetical protein
MPASGPSQSRKRERPEYWRTREQTRVRGKRIDRIIGIDGEGEGRKPHRYTYLSAADENKKVGCIGNDDHVSSYDCLRFLSSLPDRALIVGYSFFYDLTKILQDLPDDKLYHLFHEESRAVLVDGRIIYRAVQWEGFRLNFMNRRFSVQRGKHRVTIWDIFAFFQGKFTTALEQWKIAEPGALQFIVDMKDKRAGFADVPKIAIQAYCDSECTHLAKLARALIDAHKEAGFELKHYYGAGSTASALLTKLNVKEKRGSFPEEMRTPIASAFFGGRFENSHVGPIKGPIYNYDISSAYPYQTTFLPCLEHGTWGHAANPSISDVETATLALIKWSIPNAPQGFTVKPAAFGPFPVRSTKGTIAFPLAAKGGWVWKDEFLAGRRLNAQVRANEAWLYHCQCDCRPFADVPKYYLERLRWGKDSKGIVLKLGPNAIYGKLAQSRGLSPPFQSWIWAGNITGGTRGQLIDAIASVGEGHSWQVLMLATDGIFSRTPLQLSKPRDTGTSHVAKPLGGWEEKSYAAGVFCVRPGIYFPLNPNESQLKEVRARGIGKKALYERWHKIVEAWEQKQEKVSLGGIERFVGAKSAIHSSKVGYKRSENYGEWIEHGIDVSFNPAPKRAGYGTKQRLLPWMYFDWESEPYNNAMESPEGKALQLAELIAMEQPDTDFKDLE